MKAKLKQGLVNPKLLNSKEFRKEQLKVFLITVVLYCTWHASRTAWAYSKKGVKENNSFFTDGKLGFFDLCFMLAYAFGQFYNGWLGDQSDLKIFMVIGTVISLAGYFLFAILARMETYSMFIFAICFILYGFGQSRGFPGNTAILGNWIEAARRGMLIGLWNASSDNVGNIMGQQIGRMIIDINKSHWSNALFLAGGTMIIMAVIMFFYLKVHPSQAGLEVANEEIELPNPTTAINTGTNIQRNRSLNDDNSNYVAVDNQTGELTQGINFWDAWKTPGIIRYALVFACIKGSIYGLLFWLPDYLHTIMGFGQETAFIAGTYEVGQFIGGIGLGYLTDKMGKRSTGLVISLYISALIFVILALLGPGSSVSSFAFVMFFAGMFIGGPAVIVGGVISSDLGEQNSLKKDVRSVSTMAGILNGTGSVAASLIQVIIPLFKSSSFLVYFSLCLGAAVLLTPLAKNDFKGETNVANQEMDYELQTKGDRKVLLKNVAEDED